jgi:hypothetical protein
MEVEKFYWHDSWKNDTETEFFDIVDASKKYPNYEPSFKDAWFTLNFISKVESSWQYLEGETDEVFDNWCKDAWDLASAHLLALRAHIMIGVQPISTSYNHKKVKDLLDRKICLYEHSLLIQEMFAKRIMFGTPIKAGIVETVLKEVYSELNIPYAAKVESLNDLFNVVSKKYWIDKSSVKCYVITEQTEKQKDNWAFTLFFYFARCRLNVKLPDGYTVKKFELPYSFGF